MRCAYARGGCPPHRADEERKRPAEGALSFEAFRKRQSGAVLVETVMFAPVLLSLLVGVIELGRLVYTYVALEKVMYDVARSVGTAQGVNFCDDADATILAAKNLAVTGSQDGSASSIIAGLTVDMITVHPEKYSATSAALQACDCSAAGCDAASGGLGPDFIVADLPNGYPIQPLFFGFSISPILLKPHVRVPYGGT